MMKSNLTIILVIVLIFSLGVQASEIQDDKEKSESKLGKLTADHLRYLKEDNLYLINGNVKLDYDGDNINSDKLRMDRNQNLLDFSGNVDLRRDNDDRIWSQKLKLDLDQDLLVAQDDVKLKTTKQEKPLDLTSKYLKVWTDTNDMLAKEDVFVLYDGQEIKGEKLTYDDKKEELVVTENVEIKEDKDWLRSDEVVMDLKEDIIDAEGNVELEFEMED